jgi:hypothetical protein
MTRRFSTIITIVGAALVVAIPTAWGGERQGPGSLAVSPEVYDLTVSSDEPFAQRLGPGSLAVSPGVFEQTVSANEKSPIESNVGTYGDANQRGIVGDRAAWAAYRASFDKYVTEKQGPSGVVGSYEDAATRTGPVPNEPSPTNPSPITPTASGPDIQWPELGIGFGVGMLVLLGLILTVRVGRSHPVAH